MPYMTKETWDIARKEPTTPNPIDDIFPLMAIGIMMVPHVQEIFHSEFPTRIHIAQAMLAA